MIPSLDVLCDASLDRAEDGRISGGAREVLEGLDEGGNAGEDGDTGRVGEVVTQVFSLVRPVGGPPEARIPGRERRVSLEAQLPPRGHGLVEDLSGYLAS